jgi:hypothetical protein
VLFGILIIVAVTVIVFFVWPDAYASKQPQAWQAIFNLAGFIIFLGSIVAVIPIARHNSDIDDAFAAALVATAALIPTTITEFSTVAAYVMPYTLPAYRATPNHALANLGPQSGVAYRSVCRHCGVALLGNVQSRPIPGGPPECKCVRESAPAVLGSPRHIPWLEPDAAFRR